MVLVKALRTIKKNKTKLGRQEKKELAVGKLVITPPCFWSNSGVLVLSDNASFPLLQGVPGNLRRNDLTNLCLPVGSVASDLSKSFFNKNCSAGILKKLFTG